jgi:hypothetical protein
MMGPQCTDQNLAHRTEAKKICKIRRTDASEVFSTEIYRTVVQQKLRRTSLTF